MPKKIACDVVIIGAGPAGMAAAIYASRQNLKTIILSTSEPGGQMLTTPKIENYPGFEMISGAELSQKMFSQVKKHGVQLVSRGVVKMSREKEFLNTFINTGDVYQSRAVIIATGATHKNLGIAGEEQLLGRGVSYCTTCDGPFFKGKTIAVIGGGNTALTSSLFMSDIAKKVYLIHRRDEFRGDAALVKQIEAKGVEKIMNSIVVKINGDKIVKGIVVQNVNTGAQREIALDGVFVNIGITPTTAVAESIGVKLAEDGSVVINDRMQTNIPGVFAAGDITGGVRQISTAVGGGARAGLMAYKYIRALEGKEVDAVDWA